MASIPRGTHDIFGLSIQKLESISLTLINWAKSYGYGEIRTPIFEHAETFLYNDESNVSANKELFYLKNEKYVLRPENTASIVRSVLTNKEELVGPKKLFYLGPMFRYERPQAGRYREFLQFGIENINAKNILNDIELITMITDLLSGLNLDLKLRINFLGLHDQKTEWNKALSIYFQKHKDSLTESSIEKINTNPLRILDDKEDSKTECVKNAPKIIDFLADKQKEEIDQIKHHLDQLKICYIWDENLVRGIDYYTGLVYEWEFNGQALMSGGRYDELFSKFMPNRSVPCLGLAMGIERVISALDQTNYEWPFLKMKSIYLANLEGILDTNIVEACSLLRKKNFLVFTNWDHQQLKDHFKYSSKKEVDYLMIFGPKEKEKNEIIFKQQNNKIQDVLSILNPKDLVDKIIKIINLGC